MAQTRWRCLPWLALAVLTSWVELALLRASVAASKVRDMAWRNAQAARFDGVERWWRGRAKRDA